MITLIGGNSKTGGMSIGHYVITVRLMVERFQCSIPVFSVYRRHGFRSGLLSLEYKYRNNTRDNFRSDICSPVVINGADNPVVHSSILSFPQVKRAINKMTKGLGRMFFFPEIPDRTVKLIATVTRNKGHSIHIEDSVAEFTFSRKNIYVPMRRHSSAGQNIILWKPVMDAGSMTGNQKVLLGMITKPHYVVSLYLNRPECDFIITTTIIKHVGCADLFTDYKVLWVAGNYRDIRHLIDD